MQWLRAFAILSIIAGSWAQETVIDFDDIDINTDKTFTASIPKPYKGLNFDRLLAIDCEEAVKKGKIPKDNSFSCASQPNAAYGYQNLQREAYPSFNSTRGKFTLTSISVDPQYDVPDAEVELTIIGFRSDGFSDALSFNKVFGPNERDWVFEPDAVADEQWSGLVAVRLYAVDNEENLPAKIFIDDIKVVFNEDDHGKQGL